LGLEPLPFANLFRRGAGPIVVPIMPDLCGGDA
jgi:hypothetical protein